MNGETVQPAANAYQDTHGPKQKKKAKKQQHQRQHERQSYEPGSVYSDTALDNDNEAYEYIGPDPPQQRALPPTPSRPRY